MFLLEAMSCPLEKSKLVSREVPRSILKYKTVLGTLDATPKVP